MFRRLLREYFSLTRAERRGMRILGFLVLTLVVVRASLLHWNPSSVDGHFRPGDDFIAFQDSLQKLQMRLNEAFDGPEKLHHRMHEPFFFNPNTAGYDTLVLLGLSDRTARTLVNYRQAGAVFRKDSDLLRVYGLRPDDFSRLQPFIRIRTEGLENLQPAFGTAIGVEGGGSAGDGKENRSAGGPEPGYRLYEGTSFQPFELNTADSMQLVSVFGVGPVFARRIMRYRELLGGFCRPEQLLEVYGLNPRQYEELVRRSTLDTTLLRKIDLNRLDAVELACHPYLDRFQALALVAYRELEGPYRDPIQVKENRLLPDSLYRKILPYLEVNP